MVVTVATTAVAATAVTATTIASTATAEVKGTAAIVVETKQ